MTGPSRAVKVDDLRTNEQVRAMCAGARERQRAGTTITRQTLIVWRRTRGFPPPVLTVQVRGQDVELWAAGDVRAWLDDNTNERTG